MQLGYFVNLSKSHLQPSANMIHVGLGICSETMSFWIPEKKKISVGEVREKVLSDGTILLKTLQRFVGKCQSFALVIPAALLYIRECCTFMSELDDVTNRALTESVREEIKFWRFVDSFSEPIPRRQEKHISLQLSSDASNYRWGGVLSLHKGNVTFGDYWSSKVAQVGDICYKEALALFFVLLSAIDHLWDRRVKVQVDSQGLYHGWTGLRARSLALAQVLKLIFALTLEVNLCYSWNGLSPVQTWRMLHQGKFLLLMPGCQSLCGGFFRRNSLDAQGLHVTSWPYPEIFQMGQMKSHSNSFQDIQPQDRQVQMCLLGEHLYAFPPFVLISALIRLFCVLVPKYPHPRS